MIETGTLLQDRFVIEEQIGRGGMGAVYIATDSKFGSRVAIKERSYEDPELAQAFEREARLLNTLHHPILPHVSDYFTEGGRYFLVMEFIDGEDLSAVLAREGAFPVEQVVRWTDELLDGLDYLHSQDPPVIHRDIKPGNLKLTSRGNIILLDFGLAKESETNTLAGRSVFGYSRRYSPLEQIEGTGTDARSDIFSLGATVYHLITGEPPVDVLARASAIVAGRPDPLKLASEINEQVPTSVARVINSALALNAEQRFVSANAVRSALEYAVGGDLPVFEEKPEVEAPLAAAALEMSPQPAAEETFSALDAFRSGETEPTRYATSAVAVQAASAPEATGPTGIVAEPPRGRVKVRFIQPRWQRTALWTAAAVAFAVVISYVIYRSSASRSANEVPAGQSTTVPADQERSADASKADRPASITMTAEETAQDEPTETIAESREIPSRNRTVLEKSKQTLAPEQTRSSVETEPRTGPAFQPRNSTAQRASGPVRPAFERPRVVRRAVERQAPTYSIETIMTGVPPPGDRRKPPRQLTMWEQDRLRRQRFEDMIRTTRRWQPPF